MKQHPQQQYLQQKQRGFTLLELIIATSIFAIMSVLAYGGLQAMLKADAQQIIASKELDKLQMTFALLNRDILQVIQRPIRDELGDSQASLILDSSSQQLSLSRGGNFSALQPSRSELLRVQYELQQDQLIRQHWRVLDRPPGDLPFEVTLLNEVEHLQIRILDKQGNWHSDWPSAESSSEPSKTENQASALEIIIRVAVWGEIRRLIPLPAL